MANLGSISLPHGSIPTQMFGNVNLQNAMMYVNENFAAVKEGVNTAVSATNAALKDKSDSDHDHDENYAAIEHTHSMESVTGLSAALDGKAELNHEHSQYLSSLPSHYHDMSAVQGLGEQLQSKAEKTHSHTMVQVEGLSTALGVKASTSYVDDQISNVGSSIKTIADQEIEDYAADKTSVDNTPKDVVIAPTNETAEQKKERIGSEVEFARKDHQHVFETETDVAQISKLKKDGNGSKGAASFGTEVQVPRIDHSHPLNFPSNKPVDPIVKDGMGTDGAALFGSTNSYADLGHSHPLNVTSTGTPSDVVKSTGTATLGSALTYARTDHVHKMPALSATDITYDSTTVGAKLGNHETRIGALESSSGGTVKKVDNVKPGTDGNVTLNALTTTNYGTTLNSVYQAKSTKLTILESNLYDTGKVPTEMVFEDRCTTNCLAKFTNGVLSHTHNGLSNAATFNGDWPTLQKIAECFGVIGSGATTALKVLISKITGSASDTNKVVTTNANGELALNNAGDGLQVNSGTLSVKAGTNITVDTSGISVANVSGTGFVRSNNGTLEIPTEQPLTLPYGSGFVKSNGTALSVANLVASDIPDLSDTYAPASTVSFPGFGGTGSAGTASHSDHTHSNYAPSSTVSFPGFGGTGSATTASHSDHTHTVSNITNLPTEFKTAVTKEGHLSTQIVGISGDTLVSKDYIAADSVTVTTNEATPLSGYFTSKKIDATKVGSLTPNKVVETDSNGCLTASSSTYSKFSLNPTGSKFVKTSGTDGTLVEDDFEGLSNNNPQDVGEPASPGAADTAARSDHVHSIKCKSDGGIEATSDGLALGKVGKGQESTGFIDQEIEPEPLKNIVRIHWPRFDSNGRFVDFEGPVTTIEYFPGGMR